MCLKMWYKYKNLVWGIVNTVLTVIALLVFFGAPFVMDRMLLESLVLRDHSLLLEKYTTVPIPIRVKFYFFNVENPDSVEFEGAKPILRERGPYTFRQTRKKTIFQFAEDGDQLIFKERKAYYFLPAESIGPSSDVLSLPNLPKLLLANQAINPAEDDEMGGLFWDIIDATFKKLDSPMFENYTVEQILFKGFKSELLEEMKTMLKGFEMAVPEELADGMFGLQYKQNNTHGLFFSVGTGARHSNLFRVKSYNRSELLKFWKTEKCNRLNTSSDGSGFHRNVKTTDTLTIFDPSLCKPADLVYQGESEVKRVDAYRFVLSDKVFGSTVRYPENECYCMRPNSSRGICRMQGVFDLSGCAKGAPFVLSYPHFWNVDLDLVSKIAQGLHYNQSLHETFLDVDPITGTVLGGAKRVQFNIEIFRNKSLDGFAQVQPMLLPVVWLEERFEMNDEAAHMMTVLKNLAFFSKSIPVIVLIFTIMLAVRYFILHFKPTGKVSITDIEEDAPVILRASMNSLDKQEVNTVS